MDAQRVSRAQQQTPPLKSRKKRQRSSSPRPETNSKRRARSTHRSSTLKSPTLDSPSKKPSTSRPYELLRPGDNWSCPNRSRRCWLCNLPTAAPSEQLKLRDEAELERARMASEPVSSTTDTPISKNPSKKRKKDHYTEIGITFVGPRDQKFKDYILDPLGVCWAERTRSKGRPPCSLSLSLYLYQE